MGAVLHVVVGHGLPRLFLNTVSSVQALVPGEPLLVIDNASPQRALHEELRRQAEAHPATRLVRRERNERVNGKVGGLYGAYEMAWATAAAEGFDYVHLMQADMQLLWWDEVLLHKAEEIYARQPNCVNIVTMALSKDRQLAGELRTDPVSGYTVLSRYGVTDTGLYSMARWASSGMAFGASESEHARAALGKGLAAVVLPCPTEVQVPWPAVVRKGRQVGREVRTSKPFLCRPLNPEEKERVKAAVTPVTMEEVCVPWGWTCLSPMWNSDVNNVYYLALRRKDISLHGWRRGLPRWDRRGVERRWPPLGRPHRPSVAKLLTLPLWSALRSRARQALDATRSRRYAGQQ